MARQRKPLDRAALRAELNELESSATIHPSKFLIDFLSGNPVNPADSQWQPDSPPGPTLVKGSSFRPAADLLPKLDLTGVETSHPEPSHLLNSHLEASHLEASHLEASHVEPTQVQPSHPVSGRRFPFRVREARLVQDGHTGAEQTVYEYLWRKAKPLSDDLRSIRIGRKLISRDTGITETTAKAALQGLQEKLAVEREGNYDQVFGYQYKVYGWLACLSRRRQAGLTHVIKSKGVIFVDPDTSKPITKTHYPGMGVETSHLEPSHPGFTQAVETSHLGSSHPGWLGSVETSHLASAHPSYNHLVNKNVITTTIVSEELARFATVDQAGVKALIRAVQNNAPDATWEELKYFIQEKAKVLQKAKIGNPFGFLLVAIPRCFESPSFERWRAAGGADAEGVQERLQKAASDVYMQIQTARFILDNPERSEQEKEEAQAILDALEG